MPWVQKPPFALPSALAIEVNRELKVEPPVKDAGESNAPAVPSEGGGTDTPLLAPAAVVTYAPVVVMPFAPAAPFRARAAAAFLSRITEACRRSCTAAASICSRRIDADLVPPPSLCSRC
jgi:hypothetical protein